jgi:SOS response regulatory protein OraA/RecX
MTREKNDPCFEQALKMLSHRGYFSGELNDKLKAKGFSEELREEAIERLIKHKLLDDKERALDFIRYYSERGNGPRWLSYQLLQKSALTADEIDSLIEEGFPHERQVEIVEKLCAKKFPKESRDYKMRQKMAAYCYRKGFDSPINDF